MARSTWGATHHHAKLTDDEVREIRERFGIESQGELATRFGVSQQEISVIVRRLAWKHIP